MVANGLRKLLSGEPPLYIPPPCPWPERIQERALTLARMMRPHRVVGFDKIRVGGERDGAYVMVDDFAGITNAVSLGVGPNVDWDYEIAQRGIPVDEFDHTVPGPPREHELFRFHKRMISDRKTSDTETLDSILTGLGVTAPASVILKIDIENWEWPVFRYASQQTLGRFAQILCEFHAFDYLHQDDHWSNAHEGLKNLKRSFEVVHVHCNNIPGITVVQGKPIPSVIEVSLVNKARYRTRPSTETFPGPLDRPNDPKLLDYYLGRFDL